jgi:hypothetical protein
LCFGKKNVQYTHMQAVLDALLFPIARLVVAAGIPFGDVAEALKRALVRAAEGTAKAGATDSRVSLMTGLQRRDVARLRAAARLPDVEPEPSPHLSRLVGLWLADPAYAGRTIARKGPAPSFDDLASRVRKDIHPRAMLDQLVAAGTVLVEDRLVHLLVPAYRPSPSSDDQITYLGLNAGDFLSASVDNVLADTAPHFERAVHYNRLSRDAVKTLAAMFRDRQSAVLIELNEAAAALQKTSPGQWRFRAGGYFYDTDEG